MDYSPRLQKQRSCCCPPALLDLGRRRPARFARRFNSDEDDYYYYDDEELDRFPARPSGAVGWRGIWRRIVKGKRKIFDSTAPMRVPYDPYTYAQNFDEGSAWVEPDNLSRSFSARFADPSRTFARFG